MANLDALMADVYGDTGAVQNLITQEAQRQGVNPRLALAIGQAESGYDPGAKSPKGALGVMQLMPSTAKGLGVDPSDLLQNIQGGITYIKQLATQFPGQLSHVIAAYNAGPGAVKEHGGIPPYKETQGYVQKVLGYMAPKSAEAGIPTRQQTSNTPERLDMLFNDIYGAPPQAAQPQAVPAQQAPAPTMQQQAPSGVVPPEGSVTATVIPNDQPAPAISQAAAPTIPQDRKAAALAEAARPGGGGLSGPTGGASGLAAGAINVAGAAGGAILGGLTSPVTGPVGPIAGEVLGSVAANKLNKALGLTEAGEPVVSVGPVSLDAGDIVAGAVPAAIRTAGAIGPAIAKRLPGAAAIMHEEGADTLQGLAGRLQPGRPSAELYAEVAQGANPTIPSANLWLRSGELVSRERALNPSLQNKEILRVAQDFQELARHYKGQIPLDQLYANQQRLGLLVKQASAENWPQEQGLRRLYGSILSDIDAAAAGGTPEAQTLRAATQSARKEFATDTLDNLFQPGKGINTRPDGLVQLNAGKLLDTFNRKVATDELFAGSFTAGELNEIRDTLHSLTKLPRIPPPRGAMFGSGAAFGRSGLAYGATQYLTGDPTTAAMVAGLAGAAPQILGRALMSSPGRALLRSYINAGQAIGPGELAALRSVMNGNQPPSEGTPLGQ